MTDKEKNSYSSYLRVDSLLKCIKPATDERDERLFIIVHQVHELWFNLVIHELETCIKDLLDIRRPSDLTTCVAVNERLHRVALIQKTMVGIWDVVATLPPNSFAKFRGAVGRDQASGFQSVQYRIFEYLLGLKYNKIRVDLSGKEVRDIYVSSLADSKRDRERLTAALVSPSIYDAVIHALAHMFTSCNIVVRSDFTERHVRDENVLRAWRDIYAHASDQAIMHQMAELLIEIEDAFRRWRNAHLLAVARIIGGKSGTGGSSGLRYLRNRATDAVDQPIYVELWEVRNSD